MKDSQAIGLMLFIMGFGFLAYQFGIELENQKKKDEKKNTEDK